MVYDIITEPNPTLHKPSAEMKLDDIKSKENQKFIKDMVETMYVKDGVGLAAVQVNNPIKLCVIAKNYNTLNLNEDLCLINATWTKQSMFKKNDEEGCLSVPETYGQVKRYVKIRVKALDKNGKEIIFIAEDFFARIIQHEVDHTNGILFIEKAKNIYKYKKQQSDTNYPQV